MTRSRGAYVEEWAGFLDEAVAEEHEPERRVDERWPDAPDERWPDVPDER